MGTRVERMQERKETDRKKVVLLSYNLVCPSQTSVTRFIKVVETNT